MNKERKWWGLVVNEEIRVVESHSLKPTIFDFDCCIDEGREYRVVPVEVKEVIKHQK